MLSSLLAALLLPAVGADPRGLVESPGATNHALIVGVSGDLPGIPIDVKNMTWVAEHPAHHYQVHTLLEEAATAVTIARDLTAISREVPEKGTLLFYFSGHGDLGVISPTGEDMTPVQMRDALVEGRKGLAPLSRLVMIFDTCNSGSLVGPLRHSAVLADAVRDTLVAANRDGRYWQKLMVITSARDDEWSLASPKGSYFTTGFREAFEDTVEENGTVEELIRRTRENTTVSYPVARLEPESLAEEKLIPERR